MLHGNTRTRTGITAVRAMLRHSLSVFIFVLLVVGVLPWPIAVAVMTAVLLSLESREKTTVAELAACKQTLKDMRDQNARNQKTLLEDLE